MSFEGDFLDYIPDFPKLVMVSVSNVCNCVCDHCPFNADKSLRVRESEKFMSSQLMLKIIDQCEGKDTMFRATGTGEPFMNKELTNAIVYANSKNIKTGCITNGSFSMAEIEKLIKSKTDVIEISADAYDEKTYEELRKGLSFNSLKEKIEFALECKNRYSPETKILVSMVDSNGVDYDGFSVFWQKIGVDNTINRKFLTYDTFREDNKADACKEREPCPYPFQRINILADGNVTFCNYDVRQNYFMGNANNRSIHDIWHSEEYNKWRELVFKGHYEEIPLCSGCEDWKHKSWTHNIFKVIKESK